MTVLRERIQRIRFKRHQVRLWIADSGEDDQVFQQLHEEATAIVKQHLLENETLGVIATRLADLPRINAVEVLKPTTGEGVVYYNDWP